MTTQPTHGEPARTSRARTRGFIANFGGGRRCAVPECETVISRYHSGDLCWVHDKEPPKK